MLVNDFNGYTELARPLPNRDDRVFDSRYGSPSKVTYGSFSLALAKENVTGSAVILVEHGAGKEIYDLESQWITVEPLLQLMKTNERDCYAMLFALYKMADNAATRAAMETARQYKFAFIEGRLKKRRKNHKIYVDIIEPVSKAA